MAASVDTGEQSITKKITNNKCCSISPKSHYTETAKKISKLAQVLF